MGGQPARRLKQTFPPNSFDIEILDKQKIESLIWSIMWDHLVITIMAQQVFQRWIKGEILALRGYELSNSSWFYGNKSWFFHLFPFSCFTPKQVLSLKSHSSSRVSLPAASLQMLLKGITWCAFVFSVALEGIGIPCVKWYLQWLKRVIQWSWQF